MADSDNPIIVGRIIMPSRSETVLSIAKPGIGALFILNFVTVWNDYLWQLLMSVNKDISTLTVGVAGLMQDLNPNFGLKVAGAAVASLPMIIIFVLFQQYFTRGISSGEIGRAHV